MKRWVFWCIILLLLGYGAVQYNLKDDTDKPLAEDNLFQEVTSQDPASQEPASHETDPQAPASQEVTSTENKHTIKVSEAQIYKGNLLLVNRKHPVPPEGEQSAEAINLSEHRELVNGFIVLDNEIKLSTSLIEKFSIMIDAAAEDGVSRFMISSGYRDHEEQHKLYEQMGAEYALPAGYSEHNLGLSLDIGSTQSEMNRAPEGKWLKKNAWRYGFILRYPEDKVAITGIQSEPWHFRYVGLPHSAIMKEKNLVLEQYLEYLKEQKSIKTTIDQQTYEITYYPISNSDNIPVPEDGRYELSGDNMNGVIVTAIS